MAATPEAPTTLGTTMRPAPLLAALVDVLLGELLDLTVDADSDGFDVVTVEPADPLVTGVDDPAVEDTIPLISAETVALKVPVMPVIANLAENASAKALAWLASGRLLDVNRIK
jgi:hypothetical protein